MLTLISNSPATVNCVTEDKFKPFLSTWKKRGEGLRKSYAKRVALAREELIELKGVAYPEVDLAHIFNQLYVDDRPQSSCLHQLEDWGQLIA